MTLASVLRWLPPVIAILVVAVACGGDDGPSGPTMTVTLRVDARGFSGVMSDLVEDVANIEEKRAEYYFDDGVDVHIDGERIILTVPDEPVEDALFVATGRFEFHEPIADGHGGVECGTRDAPAGSVPVEDIVISDADGETVLECGDGGARVALRASEGHKEDGSLSALTADLIDRDQTRALDPQGGPAGPAVSFVFDQDGSLVFQEVTARVVGMPLVLKLDGKSIWAPTVQSEILGGNIVVGFPTDARARLVAALLRYGELQWTVTIAEG